MYKNLPAEIAAYVKRTFADKEQDEVLLILTETYTDNYNVGTILQAIKAILVLSNGDIERVKDYCVPYLNHDPRDLIMDAEKEIGDFNTPLAQRAFFEATGRE